MRHRECNILSNQEIAKGIYEMVVDTRDFPMGTPGQFMMVHVGRGDLILPRPISICRQEKNITLLVYKVFGKGTAHLGTLKAGDSVRLMGPLGNGFTIKDGLRKIALIGGGIGIPPMVSIYDHVKESGIEVDVLLGFSTSHYLTNLFTGANLHIIGDDINIFADPPFPSGHVYPESGNVMTLLDNQDNLDQKYDEIFACGPKPMLAALSKYAADKGVPLQISLEERMACGLGACMGCVVPPEYLKICCAGPVFYSDKVVLD